MARRALVALALLLSMPASALAQSNTKPSFKVVDLDGNGQISLEEAKEAGFSEKAFVRADQGRSGFLSIEEYERIQSIA